MRASDPNHFWLMVYTAHSVHIGVYCHHFNIQFYRVMCDAVFIPEQRSLYNHFPPGQTLDLNTQNTHTQLNEEDI